MPCDLQVTQTLASPGFYQFMIRAIRAINDISWHMLTLKVCKTDLFWDKRACKIFECVKLKLKGILIVCTYKKVSNQETFLLSYSIDQPIFREYLHIVN